jgi:hypothetical protein
MLDENLWVCAAGACPSPAGVGTAGNLIVENQVLADRFEQICPTGYVWVPGSARFGTLPGFCVMKYEAKNVGGVATSQAIGTPWVHISQRGAQDACRALGPGFRLISDKEWMTIAENVLWQSANWCASDGSLCGNPPGTAGRILSTGHNDNAPAAALAASTVDAQVCFGTVTAGTDTACGSVAGTQRRTHTLSNGNVLWDIAGNVWEHTDNYVLESGQPQCSDGRVHAWGWCGYAPGDAEGHILRYNALNYIQPSNRDWHADQGIGRIFEISPTAASTHATQRVFLRGGFWTAGADAGAFTLHLIWGPTAADVHVGFRCAR